MDKFPLIISAALALCELLIYFVLEICRKIDEKGDEHDDVHS